MELKQEELARIALINQDAISLAVRRNLEQQNTSPMHRWDETRLRQLTSEAHKLYTRLEKFCKRIEMGDPDSYDEEDIDIVQEFRKRSHVIARDQAASIHNELLSLSNAFKKL